MTPSEQYVIDLYQAYMRRKPTADELDYWVDQIETSRDLPATHQRFVASVSALEQFTAELREYAPTEPIAEIPDDQIISELTEILKELESDG